MMDEPLDAAPSGPSRGGGGTSVGRSLENDMPGEVTMEFIQDKLKLLNYERDFCSKKRPPWTPLSRSYFAVPSPNNNQNEQFFYFTQLVCWLFGLAGRKFNPPGQFDDPMSACTNILMELKNMGFATPSFPPAKLIKGHGDANCSLLDALVDLVLEKQGWRWQKAVYQPDGYAEEAEVDDAADVDMQEDQHGMGSMMQEPDDEEEEAYMDGRSEFTTRETKEAKEEEDTKPLHSQVDAAEWKMELERVGPQLRVTVLPDGKDWRAHLESTHSHQETIIKALPDSKAQLDKVEAEVATALEKIDSREKFVNTQLEHLTREYRTCRENMALIQERYNKSTENVAELTNELAHLNEELENVKQQVIDRGDNIGDTKPLKEIKDAMVKLKAELKLMEVRIGVASHTLLQTSLKNKENAVRSTKSKSSLPDYDSEEGF